MGWYALTTESNETVLWHPGGNTGFIAQALIDLGAGNAILAVTNLRTSHRHLFRAMEQIQKHYAAIAHFPKLN
jgi:hypothetical protein